MYTTLDTHLLTSTSTKNVRPSLWSTRIVSPSFTWPSTLSIAAALPHLTGVAIERKWARFGRREFINFARRLIVHETALKTRGNLLALYRVGVGVGALARI